MNLIDGPLKDQIEESLEQHNRMPNWLKSDENQRSSPELYEILGRWVDISQNLEIKRLKKRLDKLEKLLDEKKTE